MDRLLTLIFSLNTSKELPLLLAKFCIALLSATVDKLMAEAKTLSDASGNYTQIEQILAEEMPVIPIYHYAGVFMLNTQLKGWPYHNVEQNWYSRNLYKVAE